jgi:Zn-dependent protease with chaperone function
MKALAYTGTAKGIALAVVVAITLTPLATYAQTPIKIHSNKFAPGDDVKLGQEAAAEAEKQMQVVRDPELGGYLERVGERLAAAIPTEFQHQEFRYTFKVVNAKEINAFALPGGPMYVNSGMISAARSEDEMAGVMAHEISHVALRHGTAQVTKAQKYQMLSGIMGVGGQILGGPIGSIAQMGSQGVGVYLLKFSREYETEADLLGARIMANAGYDPRELANMFKTIETQGGGGGPSFLSDHPSPKDRVAKINQEAQVLQINTAAIPDKHDFTIAQQRLSGRGGGGSFTGNQAYRNQGNSNPNSQPSNSGSTGNQGNSNPNSQPANMSGTGNQPNPATSANLPPPSGRVDATSANYKSYKEDVFAVSVPDNWQELNEQSGLWFAPKGGYGAANGQNVFTHGVSFGAKRTEGKSSQQAMDEFVKSMTQGNTNMRARGGYQPMNNIAGRNWQLITFDNVNEATGRKELVNIATTPLRTGDLLYMIAVCPTDEYPKYQSIFLTILRSIQLND